MSPHPEADALGRFRATLYATGLGHRKDSLFETLDAVLTATAPGTLARLSLAPGFRRGWASVPDALAAGTVHLDPVGVLAGGEDQWGGAFPKPRGSWALPLDFPRRPPPTPSAPTAPPTATSLAIH